MKKRVLKILLILVLCIMGFFVLLHVSPIRMLVLKFIIHKVETATRSEIHVQSLDYNLLKWRFTLNQVSISKRNSNAQQSPVFFTAKQIMVDIPSPLAWKKTLHLQNLQVIEPKIVYYLSASGNDNFPFTQEVEEKPSLQEKAQVKEVAGKKIPSFLIEQLDIRQADIVVKSAADQWELELHHLDTHLRYSENDRHRLSVKLQENGMVQFQERQFPIKGLALEALIDEQKVEFKRGDLQVGPNHIELLGMLNHYLSDSPMADITVNSRFSSTEAASFLAAIKDIPGFFTVGIHLRGPIHHPEIKVHVDAEDLVVNHPFETVASGSLDAILKGFSLDGVKAGGYLRLSAVKGNEEKTVSSGKEIQGYVEFNIAPNELKLDLQDINTLGMNMNGQVTSETKNLQGKIQVKIPDLKRSLTLIKQFPIDAAYTQWTTTLLEKGIKGNSILDIELQGPVDSPKVTANIDSSLQISESVLIVMDGLLTYEEQGLKIEKFHLRQGEADASVIVKGNIPLGDAKTAKPLEFHLQGHQIDTLLLMQLTGGSLPFRGLVSFTSDVLMDLKNNSLMTQVQELTFQSGNQSIRNREPFQLAYRSGLLTIDNLVMLMTHNGPVDHSPMNLSVGFQEPGFLTKLPPGEIHLDGDLVLDETKKDVGHRPLKIAADIDCRSLSLFYPSLVANGNLKINGEIKGKFSQPLITGQINLEGGAVKINGLPGEVENITLHVNMPGHQFKVEHIVFNWLGGHFVLKGNLPFTALFNDSLATESSPGTDPFSLALSIRQGSTRMMGSMLPATWKDKISGSMEADFEIQGQRFQLESLQGSGRIDKLLLNIQGFKFQQEEPILLRLKQGEASLEQFRLTGPESVLQGKGTLQLKGEQKLHFEWDGQVNSKILNGFSPEVVFSGTNLFRLLLDGTLTEPHFTGELTLQDGMIKLISNHLYISGLKGKVNLEKDRIYMSEPIIGNINGGQLQITGSEKGIEFQIKNAETDIPLGMRANLSGSLVFEPQVNRDRFKLSGSLSINQGSYTEAFSFDSQLYNYVRQISTQSVVQTIEQEAFPLDFKINLFTEKPIHIENNLAKLDLSANLNLSGSISNPVLAGRADITENGEIYLGKNTFYIERGAMNFINPYLVEPELDISARTQIDNKDIRLILSGTIRELSATLSSIPPLPESHIISLLVSGKSVESTSPTTLSKVGNQTLTYLSSVLTGKVENAVKHTLGIDTVRLDGILVATKENPGARVTIGHHLASNFEVILSQSIKQSQNRTWIVNYNPLPSLNLQASRQDNNAYSLGVNHEIQFGLKTPKPDKGSKKKSKKNAGQKKIESIVITGDCPIPQKEIRKKFDLKKGKAFQFFRLQKDREKVLALFHKKNYLNADLVTRKEEKEKTVKIIYEINAGPQVFLHFEGATVPGKVRKKARRNWITHHTDQQRFNAVTQQIHRYFFKKRYYDISIQTKKIETDKTKKQVIFLINQGPGYKKWQLDFKGKLNYPSRKLRKLVKQAGLIPFVTLNPGKISQFLEQWYRQEGFLSVAVSPPMLQKEPGEQVLYIAIDIQEGPRYRVGEITFNSNLFIDSDTLAKNLKIKTGSPFSSKISLQAVTAVESLYARKGFYNSFVIAKLRSDKVAGTVNMEFFITEKPRMIIKEVRIKGNQKTLESTVKKELLFKPGDILDYRVLNKTRKNLYDIGIFKRVNLEVLTEETTNENNERGCVVEVRLQERKPYQLRYGVQADTETSFSITGQLTDSNLGGKALLAGTSFRYNKIEQDIRLFTRFPNLLSKKMSTELFLFYNRNEESSSTVPIQRIGVTLQHQWRIAEKSMLSLSYTYEKYRAETDANLGHVTASYTLDTRDSFWNASKGWFLSQSIQYAGKILGSELAFSRYLGQVSFFKNLMPSLVWATSVHVGLGDALGQELLPGERFFAGGSTTLRGFDYNGVGPVDADTLEPAGGEALFLFKQELRYRLFPGFSTVLFLDIGNVYATISDFDPFNIRKALGIGVRYNLFGLLLRLDWGFKLDRKPGESLSQVYLSIGQSF